MPDSLKLEDQIIASLRRITRAIDLHSRLLLQRYGLTAPQLAALRAIGRMQPVSVGALARQIHLSRATVTGILSRLEKRNLVQRARGHQDRRSVFVQLTEQGVALIDQAPPMLQERFAKRLAGLQQWEQTMILSTLQRIAAMMDVEDVAAEQALLSQLDQRNPEAAVGELPLVGSEMPTDSMEEIGSADLSTGYSPETAEQIGEEFELPDFDGKEEGT